MYWTFLENKWVDAIYVLSTSDTNLDEAINYIETYGNGWASAAVYDAYGNIYYAKEMTA